MNSVIILLKKLHGFYKDIFHRILEFYKNRITQKELTIILFVLGISFPIVFSLLKKAFIPLNKRVEYIVTKENRISEYNSKNILVRELTFNRKLSNNPILIKEGDDRIIITTSELGEFNAGNVSGISMKNEVIWNIDPYDKALLTPKEAGRETSGFFRIIDFRVDTFFSTKKQCVLVVAQDPNYNPLRLLILDPLNGNILFDYYNAGTTDGPQNIILGDFNGDRSKEIVMSAANNNLTVILCNSINFPRTDGDNMMTVFMIEPKMNEKMCSPGLSFPGYDSSYTCFKWYFLSYPIYKLIIPLKATISRGEVADLRYVFDADTSIDYYIDSKGVIIRCNPSLSWTKKYGNNIPPLLGFKFLGGRKLKSYEFVVDSSDQRTYLNLAELFDDYQLKFLEGFLELTHH